MAFIENAESKYKKIFLSVIFELTLLIISSLLFTLAFPSVVSRWGISIIAFIAIIPVFIVIHSSNWIKIPLYGLFYGFVSYAVFNYWLAAFHPLALLVVPTIYSVYFFLLFPVLKIIDQNSGKYTYLLQIAAWLAYEYLRTKAFLGYAYGILGYSQYLNTNLIAISDIGGVWFVSLLVIFPSAFIGNSLKKGFKPSIRFIKDHKIDVLVYFFVVICSFSYGMFSKVDYTSADKIRLALVQHNIDPRKGGYAAYGKSLEKLKRLSDQAMEHDPRMLVWPETAFVPSINWHKQFRRNRSAYLLVDDLEAYLVKNAIPVVLGNDDGVMAYDDKGREVRKDYNAAVFFNGKEFASIYRKMHLVPFSEHFPYKKLFPWMYQLLVDNNTNFWEKGSDPKIFKVDGVRFSTPICFEDSFGYLSRKFINNGAQIIVNITNDSWSKSVPSEMQHMAMAVFRSVENRVSLVRSTNGGITCHVDPNGRILSYLEPFVEDYLIADVAVFDEKTTFYTRYGDYAAYISVLFTACLLIFYLIRYLRFRLQK